MSASNKPATPLPCNLAVRWTDDRAYLESADGGRFATTADSATGKKLEAVAHAANAYPQLVAALRKAISEADGWSDEARGVPCGGLESERALLRTLGEAS